MIKQWSKVKVGDKVFFYGRYREVQAQMLSRIADEVLFVLGERMIVNMGKEDFVMYRSADEAEVDTEIKLGSTVDTPNGIEIVTWVGERQYSTSGGAVWPLVKETHYA